MMVADTTETCRNMDWLCENFRNTKFMEHNINNFPKNISLSYFKTIMLQITPFLWHSWVEDLQEKNAVLMASNSEILIISYLSTLFQLLWVYSFGKKNYSVWWMWKDLASKQLEHMVYVLKYVPMTYLNQLSV
jgi:ABC-type microcin C transport system permease subunit YejB